MMVTPPGIQDMSSNLLLWPTDRWTTSFDILISGTWNLWVLKSSDMVRGPPQTLTRLFRPLTLLSARRRQRRRWWTTSDDGYKKTTTATDLNYASIVFTSWTMIPQRSARETTSWLSKSGRWWWKGHNGLRWIITRKGLFRRGGPLTTGIGKLGDLLIWFSIGHLGFKRDIRRRCGDRLFHQLNSEWLIIKVSMTISSGSRKGTKEPLLPPPI